MVQSKAALNASAGSISPLMASPNFDDGLDGMFGASVAVPAT
jgi:hypothetical protein